jgi:hypothetical protein
MAQREKNLIRKLNSRERRRLSLYNMIPVDAIDPSCSTRVLIENKTTKLYRYGCSMQDMNIQIEGSGLARKKNLIFHLQGFETFSLAHQFLFIQSIPLSVFFLSSFSLNFVRTPMQYISMRCRALTSESKVVGKFLNVLRKGLVR